MICQRCHGLMVVDYLIDMQGGGVHHWLRAWRCVNCGDVVEPGIFRHRLGQRSSFPDPVERGVKRTRSSHLVFDGMLQDCET
jgi:hypothetical protein